MSVSVTATVKSNEWQSQLHLMIAVACFMVIVWAGMLGKPDDWAGGNWVWLKEGNPGV